MAEQRVHRRLAAILAADVVGYSRLVEADEAGTVARLKTLQTDLIHPMIDQDGGRVVKLMGDGVLVEFGSAVDAVHNALAIQAEMAQRNVDAATTSNTPPRRPNFAPPSTRARRRYDYHRRPGSGC